MCIIRRPPVSRNTMAPPCLNACPYHSPPNSARAQIEMPPSSWRSLRHHAHKTKGVPTFVIRGSEVRLLFAAPMSSISQNRSRAPPEDAPARDATSLQVQTDTKPDTTASASTPSNDPHRTELACPEKAFSPPGAGALNCESAFLDKMPRQRCKRHRDRRRSRDHHRDGNGPDQLRKALLHREGVNVNPVRIIPEAIKASNAAPIMYAPQKRT